MNNVIYTHMELYIRCVSTKLVIYLKNTFLMHLCPANTTALQQQWYYKKLKAQSYDKNLDEKCCDCIRQIEIESNEGVNVNELKWKIR